jgi:DNA-binding MarR family transcriptional regulator
MESDETIKECLRRINRITVLFSRELDYPGYTFNELSVLGSIVRNPGIIARDICGYNLIDRGYLSKILKKLDQNSLIVRIPDKHPPFEKVLYVTLLGEEVYSEAEQLIDKSISDRLSVFQDAECKAFYKCASEMLGYLKKMEPDSTRTSSESENEQE